MTANDDESPLYCKRSLTGDTAVVGERRPLSSFSWPSGDEASSFVEVRGLAGASGSVFGDYLRNGAPDPLPLDEVLFD